ncbi:DEAD/DEAH box helicase family protein [Candidatus Darwinibacter acetoxidans]
MGNVITNYKVSLLNSLQDSFLRANQIKIVVSFVMESGVRLLLPHLQEAAARGVPVQILTSLYLNITEPSALYLLKDQLGSGADIRIYESGSVAFHPKTYIFIGSGSGEVYVGSSNLSRSALVDGIEWNYRLLAQQKPEDYQEFIANFDRLFAQARPLDDEWLKEYSLSWKRPRWLSPHTVPQEEPARPQPRGAQIEALHYLEQSRKEGFRRGMVVMATGVGKTYLAAFDSVKFRRVLFVAHREEILRQARDTFHSVVPTKTKGWFNAEVKTTDADLIFASVQTLSQEQYLHPSYFPADHFDYLVVDEFHHVAAQSYQRIVSYFEPRFMLGLTATPYRMDNQDIFQFCEDNVVYEINLQEAINKDYLVPFHYYGVYDDTTDYSKIATANGRYVSDQLERALSIAARGDLILKRYLEYRGERALGFCSTIKHANFMTEYFQRSGVRAAAVHSGSGRYVLARQDAVEALRSRDIEVIFSVDQFNEGVDIPEVDLVMFLRPTESYTVFLQQLGRGLRKADHKDFLTVLDFIGNYKRAHWIPLILAGRNPQSDRETIYRIRDLSASLAEGCTANFDMRLLDVFAELRRHDPLPERMKADYWRLKSDLGRRPLRLDIHVGSDIHSREYLRPRHLQPHKGYLRFLADLGELSAQEESWLGTALEEFLIDLETTSMSKMYKIPTIGAFIQEGKLQAAVPSSEIGRALQSYYQDPRFHGDMQDRSSRDFQEWPLEKWTRLAEINPIKFLDKSSPFFQYDQINKKLLLAPVVVDNQSPALIAHIQDILRYRERLMIARLYKRNND